MKWCVMYASDQVSYRHHLWTKGEPYESAWKPRDKLADGLALFRKRRMRPIGVIDYEGSLHLHGGPDDGLEWEFHADLTPDQVKEKVDEARKRKWRPTLIHRHRTDADKFAVVLVANPKGVPWEYRAPLTVKEYETALADLRGRGLRPLYVQSWIDGKNPVYSAVWVGDYQPPAPPPERAPAPRAIK